MINTLNYFQIEVQVIGLISDNLCINIPHLVNFVPSYALGYCSGFVGRISFPESKCIECYWTCGRPFEPLVHNNSARLKELKIMKCV